MVVFYHYPKELLPNSIYNFFLIRNSWLFVDFFFVLSGFVISYNYVSIDNKSDLLIFIKKRLIRLYPLLFYTVLIFLCFEIISPLIFPQLVNYPNTLIENIELTVESLLFFNSTPIIGITSGMNHPSWSISSEMISYIVYGIFTYYCTRRVKNIFSFFIIIVSLAILFFISNNTKGIHFTGDYGFLRGFIGFFIGALVYEFYSNKNFTIQNSFEYLITLLLILSFYFVNIINNNFTFIFPFIFGLFILFLTKTNGYISKFLEHKILRFYGRISYSIYLNHIIIIITLPRLLIRLLTIEQHPMNQILLLLMTLIFLIIYSNYTHKIIELYFGNILKRRLL